MSSLRALAVLFALFIQGLLPVPAAAQPYTAADSALVDEVVGALQITTPPAIAQNNHAYGEALHRFGMAPEQLADSARAAIWDRFDRAMLTEAHAGLQDSAVQRILSLLAVAPIVSVEPDSAGFTPQRQGATTRLMQATQIIGQLETMMRTMFAQMIEIVPRAREDMEQEAFAEGLDPEAYLERMVEDNLGEARVHYPLYLHTHLVLVPTVDVETSALFWESDAGQYVVRVALLPLARSGGIGSARLLAGIMEGFEEGAQDAP